MYCIIFRSSQVLKVMCLQDYIPSSTSRKVCFLAFWTNSYRSSVLLGLWPFTPYLVQQVAFSNFSPSPFPLNFPTPWSEGLWPPKFLCCNQIFNRMAFGGGVLGRKFIIRCGCHEWAYKRDSREIPDYSVMWYPSFTQEADLTRQGVSWHLDLGLPVYRTVKNKVLLFNQSLVFCHMCWNGLRHSFFPFFYCHVSLTVTLTLATFL